MVSEPIDPNKKPLISLTGKMIHNRGENFPESWKYAMPLVQNNRVVGASMFYTDLDVKIDIDLSEPKFDNGHV
jgi:hypothetical protein